tara:strand:+ start:71 stop:286 length:216 start_codon:yes stop_codon:yes gene_type:complete
VAKIYIEDPFIGLKLDGLVKGLYRDLDKEKIKEIAHHVYHQMDMNPLREQAEERIHKYVKENVATNKLNRG